MADIDLEVSVADAVQELRDGSDAVDQGAERAVRQLAVLAEGAMKDEAPEGAGRDQHLRDTVDTRFRRGGKRANIGARKRTNDGRLLAEIVVEGTDPSSYTLDDPPPVEPLMDWADAKLGDPDAAWAIRRSIAQTGHETLPNPFVARAFEDWSDQVEDVAGEAVRDALSDFVGGGGG